MVMVTDMRQISKTDFTLAIMGGYRGDCVVRVGNAMLKDGTIYWPWGTSRKETLGNKTGEQRTIYALYRVLKRMDEKRVMIDDEEYLVNMELS